MRDLLQWQLLPPITVGVVFYLLFVAAGLVTAVLMFKVLRGIRLI